MTVRESLKAITDSHKRQSSRYHEVCAYTAPSLRPGEAFAEAEVDQPSVTERATDETFYRVDWMDQHGRHRETSYNTVDEAQAFVDGLELCAEGENIRSGGCTVDGIFKVEISSTRCRTVQRVCEGGAE
jgi:hypothetical protein